MRRCVTSIARKTAETLACEVVWHAAPAEAASWSEMLASSVDACTPRSPMESVLGRRFSGSEGPLMRTKSLPRPGWGRKRGCMLCGRWDTLRGSLPETHCPTLPYPALLSAALRCTARTLPALPSPALPSDLPSCPGPALARSTIVHASYICVRGPPSIRREARRSRVAPI